VINAARTVGVLLGWFWIFGYSLAFLLPSTLIVAAVRPSAAGSGMPELIGYLNGTLVKHVFGLKTLLVKFASCALAVGSGMPVGPEGPMIHMGAIIGEAVAGLARRFGLPTDSKVSFLSKKWHHLDFHGVFQLNYFTTLNSKHIIL